MKSKVCHTYQRSGTHAAVKCFPAVKTAGGPQAGPFEFPAPNRQEKARFLRTLAKPQISMRQFVFAQITYLRKRVLALSLLLLVPALMGAHHNIPQKQ